MNNYENLNNLMNNLTETALSTLPTENFGGLDTVVFKFTDSVKDADGNTKLIERSVTNPALIKSFVKIQTIDIMSRFATSIYAFEFSKLTKAQAEEYKCKNIIDLIYKVFPTLAIDKTTASKYRKVGLIFCDRTKDSENFAFRNGIDYDVSVNTLDRLTTLANPDKKNLDDCTEDELTELFNNFYQKYVVTGQISLNASQSVVKSQVATILKDSEKVVATIKKEEVKEIEISDKESKDTENSENSESSATPSAELSNNSESKQSSAEYCLNMLKTIFEGNKNALNLISKLTKEVEKLED